MKAIENRKIIVPDRTVYLASGSPRRRELLSNLGIDFEILDNNTEENFDHSLEPREYVVRASELKAENTLNRIPEGYIITADTIVYLDNKILEKPVGREDAYRMLSILSGKIHQVFTGITVCACPEKIRLSGYEKTDVSFSNLSKDEIKWYLDTGEYSDKAGAYAIQGLASIFINGINGCYFNVVGLPLRKLYCILSEMIKQVQAEYGRE